MSLIPPPTTRWSLNATTVAGSATTTAGSGLSSLNLNQGIQIVDNILYIADKSNHRIVLIQPNSTTAFAVMGSGSGSGAAKFNQTTDLFVTDAFIYVLDAGNYRVQRWSRNGSNGTTVAGITGSSGSSSNMNRIGYSYGIYLDKDGYLYVADQPNNRILRFPPNSSSGTNGVVVAGTGTPGVWIYSTQWSLHSVCRQ